jgi:ABC-2 type transport system ATP-binding protein
MRTFNRRSKIERVFEIKTILWYFFMKNLRNIVTTILSVTNLRKVYSGKSESPAVDGISFDLKEKEILGLLGPNGSGKTTTIQMLLGTLSKSSGSIVYFGKDFDRCRGEILQDITYASTYTSLPWLLSVEENLEVIGRLYGLSPKESRQRFFPLLERFGILDLKGNPINSLSAGQVTRVMLVKAFFIGPKVILMDEPTASLDPCISREICEFIREQRANEGTSILFTSHKMEEVAELCDRVIFLKKGKIIANDVPQNLARKNTLFCLRLTLFEGMEEAIALANQHQLSCKADHRILEISLAEDRIPFFLNLLGQQGILYLNIQIEEPSLEDYFLHISGESNEF